MKTLYLKSNTKSGLIADISKVIAGYAGEKEFTNGIIHGHFIGEIPKNIKQETGQVLEWENGWHANILAPNEFDSSIFTTITEEPSNPVHQFA